MLSFLLVGFFYIIIMSTRIQNNTRFLNLYLGSKPLYLHAHTRVQDQYFFPTWACHTGVGSTTRRNRRAPVHFQNITQCISSPSYRTNIKQYNSKCSNGLVLPQKLTPFLLSKKRHCSENLDWPELRNLKDSDFQLAAKRRFRKDTENLWTLTGSWQGKSPFIWHLWWKTPSLSKD